MKRFTGVCDTLASGNRRACRFKGNMGLPAQVHRSVMLPME